MERDSLGRRSYLAAVGATGIAGVAGCVGFDDGSDGDGSDDETEPEPEDGGGNGDGETPEDADGDGNGDGETPEDADGGDGEEATTIVAGTAPGFPPFEFREGGELVGFDVDLIEEVIARTDYEFGGWETFEFDSLIPALDNENIDVIAAAMTITEERAEQIAFSDPYYEANQSVLVRSDDDFSPGSREDLEGRVVGAQGGTTGEDEVDALIEDGIISEGDKNTYDNYTLAVSDLENGNIDAVIIDVPVAENFAASRDVEVAFTIETGEEYGFGLRQEDDRLEAINDGLAEVMDDGTYEELVNEWFASDEE